MAAVTRRGIVVVKYVEKMVRETKMEREEVGFVRMEPLEVVRAVALDRIFVGLLGRGGETDRVDCVRRTLGKMVKESGEVSMGYGVIVIKTGIGVEMSMVMERGWRIRRG